MRAEEMFRRLGYKRKTEDCFENKISENEYLYLCVDKEGCSKWFKYIHGNEVGTGMLSMKKDEMEACIKALTENETSFDLDEAVEKATYRGGDK